MNIYAWNKIICGRPSCSEGSWKAIERGKWGNCLNKDDGARLGLLDGPSLSSKIGVWLLWFALLLHVNIWVVIKTVKLLSTQLSVWSCRCSRLSARKQVNKPKFNGYRTILSVHIFNISPSSSVIIQLSFSYLTLWMLGSREHKNLSDLLHPSLKI